MSVTTKGVTWAMRRPSDTRPIVFAVVESSVYSRAGDGDWHFFSYGSGNIADFIATTATKDLEAGEGAVLIAGPMEFGPVIPVDETVAIIGWIAEQTLGLISDSLPPPLHWVPAEKMPPCS